MKRVEMFGLLKEIEGILKVSKKVKLNYFLQKNINSITKDKEILDKIIEPSDKFKEYESKRIELCKEYCDKDSDGMPIVKNNKYLGLDDNDEFNEKINSLLNEYKNIIDEYQDKIREYEQMLDDDVDIEFVKFDIDLIPDDLVTGEELTLIFKYLIKE